MIATRERQHRERIFKLKKFQAKILPVAAIFGGNASGKTNLFMALNFARTLIIEGTKSDELIPVEPFRLDSKSLKRPTDFKFELLIDNLIYEYSFSVNKNYVLKEKLVIFNSSSEKVIFDRVNDRIALHSYLSKNEYLKFIIDGTWENQLFLTNAVSHKSVYKKTKELKAVYNWFKKTLELVAPDSRFAGLEQFIDEASPLYENMSEILQHLDTGIFRLGNEEVPFNNLRLPEQIKSKIEKELKEGESLRVLLDQAGRFVVSRENGEILAKKLIAYHRTLDDKETPFEIHLESHGTQRAIDLLPAFLDLSATQQSSPKRSGVYLIDEIDRCLHSLMTRTLLETYLKNCNSGTQTQLLFTTHDNSLIDQRLFRRDEIWHMERDTYGQSSLFSLSDFKDIRYDKDIRKSYLQGRYGGIPEIQPAEISRDFIGE